MPVDGEGMFNITWLLREKERLLSITAGARGQFLTPQEKLFKRNGLRGGHDMFWFL